MSDMISFDEILANGKNGPKYVYNFNADGAANYPEDAMELMKSKGIQISPVLTDKDNIFAEPYWFNSPVTNEDGGFTLLSFQVVGEPRRENFFGIIKDNKHGLLLKKSREGQPLLIAYTSSEPKIKKITYDEFYKDEVASTQANLNELKSVANDKLTALLADPRFISAKEAAKNLASQGYAKGSALASQGYAKGSALASQGLGMISDRFNFIKKPSGENQPGGRKRRTRAKRSAKSKRRNIQGGKKTRRGKI